MATASLAVSVLALLLSAAAAVFARRTADAAHRTADKARLQADAVLEVVTRQKEAGRGPKVRRDGRQQGHVKWWDAEEGYGFIAVDGGGVDVFAHISFLSAYDPSWVRYGTTPGHWLDEGQCVEFEIMQGPKGPEARNVVTVYPDF